MPYEQSTRWASVSVPGVGDPVFIEGFSTRERVSELFTYTVKIIAPNGAVDFEPALGNSVSLTMLDSRGMARSFSGLLFEAEFTTSDDEGWHYRLVLGPWLALLAANQDFQVFQNKSVLDILQQVISDAGFATSYIPKAEGSYPVRTFCVQYRESTFAFLSRLMEEEGLYYYFQHTSDGKHQLVVCDDVSQHPYAPGLAQLPYIARGDRDDASTAQPHLSNWVPTIRPGAGKVTLRDYDFQQPTNTFETSTAASGDNGPAQQAELYDYPGRYGVYAAGDMSSQKDRYSSVRLQASRAELQRCTAAGDAFALACGTRFSLTRHPDDTQNQEYLVIGSTHKFSDESYRSGRGSAGPDLNVSVDLIPSSTQWRTPQRTPKPVVAGPQTATVVGPAGQVIYSDQYGRVKVQFHWDRKGKMDQNSSCWIRVSQAWADAGFGTMLIPRIGEEVIIDFINGDPDRPIITGRVYNAQNVVPYALPDNQTRSTWKSQSVGGSGSNEIRFEDQGGAEEIYVHAERDMNTVIGNDETHTVQQGSRSTTISQDDSLEVQQGNATRTIDMGDYTLTASLGSVTITAMQQIVLQVGTNTLTIDQTGLTVNALMVTINADAIVQINGTLVMIN